jgi:Mrp family chromosome partitioning ATPase
MKHRSISSESLAHEFRLLRNRIETGIQSPALVFVTSATDDDGTGFAAHGIASSLSRTHQRTVLVTTNPLLSPPAPAGETPGTLRRRASDRVESSQRATTAGGISVVCISAERVATISRSRVAEMVEELRGSNDYVVVDAGNLPSNGLGLLLLGTADVAIIAFRAGRAEQPADKLMLDALERAESKVVGVVMTDRESIDHFNEINNPTEATPEHTLEAPQTERNPAVLLRRRLELVVSRLVRSF